MIRDANRVPLKTVVHNRAILNKFPVVEMFYASRLSQLMRVFAIRVRILQHAFVEVHIVAKTINQMAVRASHEHAMCEARKNGEL